MLLLLLLLLLLPPLALFSIPSSSLLHFLNNVYSQRSPATTATTVFSTKLFVFSFSFQLCTLKLIISSSWLHRSKRQIRRSRSTWEERPHMLSNTEHSLHVSWHKLEIDNRNLFNICQLQNTLLFHSGLANNFSCSKGSRLRAGYEGFPHVGKE